MPPPAVVIAACAVVALIVLANLLIFAGFLRARRMFAELAERLGLRITTTAESVSSEIRGLSRFATSRLAVGQRGALRVEFDLIRQTRHPPRTTRVAVSDGRRGQSIIWVIAKRYRPLMLPSQRVLEGRQGAFLVFGEPAVIDAIAWQSAMSSLAAFPREVVRLDFDAKSLRLEWVELEADPQVVELAFRICGEWLACAPAGATAIR